MTQVQLDFFKSENECEMDSLRREVKEVKSSLDKVRKGTYARINEMKKECDDLKIRLEIMERNICKVKDDKLK